MLICLFIVVWCGEWTGWLVCSISWSPIHLVGRFVCVGIVGTDLWKKYVPQNRCFWHIFELCIRCIGCAGLLCASMYRWLIWVKRRFCPCWLRSFKRTFTIHASLISIAGILRATTKSIIRYCQHNAPTTNKCYIIIVMIEIHTFSMASSIE